MQYLKQEIRDRILSAAVEEFKINGYADASIRNIANNAQISLGNIYRYFTNKESLYFAVVNPFMQNVKNAIENEFIFEGRTMKQVSEVVVSFLMEHSDELHIIRKGNTVHYDTFVKYIVGVISQKLREMMENVFPQINEKLQNPKFFDAIAQGFLTSLFLVLDNEDSLEVQESKTREIITFYFGHMKDRFYHFGIDEE